MNKDTIFLIGLKLKTEDLYNYSLVNKKFKEIISSDIFWIKKYKYDFKEPINFKENYMKKKKEIQDGLIDSICYNKSQNRKDEIYSYLNKGASINDYEIEILISYGNINIIEELYDNNYISIDIDEYLKMAIKNKDWRFALLLLKKGAKVFDEHLSNKLDNFMDELNEGI